MSTPDPVTPNDIKAKLHEIQGEATEELESAKNQVIAAGALVALAVIIVVFLLGKRSGKRASAIIEVRRG